MRPKVGSCQANLGRVFGGASARHLRTAVGLHPILGARLLLGSVRDLLRVLGGDRRDVAHAGVA